MKPITISLRPLYNIQEFLFFLSKPGYHTMNNPVSMEWDKQLNELMDKHKFERINTCMAKIGGVTVWVANHPYASFTPMDKTQLPSSIRPRRMTIYRAWKKLTIET